MKRKQATALLSVLLLILVIAACKKEEAEQAPASAAAPAASADMQAESAPLAGPDLPFVVPAPQMGHTPFAEFAWQEFVALMWPAKLDPAGVPVRGEPDRTLGLGDLSRPRVWETWKADWELVGEKGGPQPQPTEWSSWKVIGGGTPCDESKFPAHAHWLTMPTKMDSIATGINQATINRPLIDQASAYVRYEIRLNQSEYEEAVAKKWYLKSSQPASFQFTMSTASPKHYGAIELKAAWREVSASFDGSRYYTINAIVVDPGSPPVCRMTRLALVGFHIAHKTAPFAEWVWSTFEHVLNVPGDAPAGPPLSFNNGTDTPATKNGYDKLPPKLDMSKPLPPGKPVQVTRFTPIPPEIQAVNNKYRGSSPVKGTVWENYIVVGNQWPTRPGTFTPGKPYAPDVAGNPFPADHVANVTMETYLQNQTGGVGSCLSCHYSSASNQDFSYVLSNAWTPPATLRAKRATTTGPESLRNVLDRVYSEQQ